MAAGYSGKALSDKLGIRPGHRVALVHPPRGMDATPGLLPDGVALSRRASRSAPVTLLFVTEALKLRREFAPLAAGLADGAMLWVDVKVCAIDETWSGLKFLRRRA